jgi:hypothetical protein
MGRVVSSARTEPLTARLSPDLKGAASAAASWLLGSRTAAGWWRDFALAPGCSDEWVTAYVGCALAASHVGGEHLGQAVEQAWELLLGRQRAAGGWAYNALAPADADSTAWTLELARLLGFADEPAADRARHWLDGHRRVTGGVTTYADSRPIRAFTGIPEPTSFEGWTAAHTCVTAGVARSLRDRRDIKYLRRTQEPAGNWSSYWWCEPAYATALAVEALSDAAEPGDEARLVAAVRWGARQVEEGRPSERTKKQSAFRLAWCVRLLSIAPESTVSGDTRESRESAARWLLDRQLPSGAWEPSAQLRVPPPDVVDPETFTDWVEGGRIERAVVLDQNAIFTTATALLAITALQSRLSELRSSE